MKQGEGGCARRPLATQGGSRRREEACQGARPGMSLALEVIQVRGIWGDDTFLLTFAKKEKNESMERLKR